MAQQTSQTPVSVSTQYERNFAVDILHKYTGKFPYIAKDTKIDCMAACGLLCSSNGNFKLIDTNKICVKRRDFA